MDPLEMTNQIFDLLYGSMHKRPEQDPDPDEDRDWPPEMDAAMDHQIEEVRLLNRDGK